MKFNLLCLALLVGLSGCRASNLLGDLGLEGLFTRNLKLKIGTAMAEYGTKEFYRQVMGYDEERCNSGDYHTADTPPLIWYDPGDGSATKGHPCYDYEKYMEARRQAFGRDKDDDGEIDEGYEFGATFCNSEYMSEWFESDVMGIPLAPNVTDPYGNESRSEHAARYCAAHFTARWPLKDLTKVDKSDYVALCEYFKGKDREIRENVRYLSNCAEAYDKGLEKSKKNKKRRSVRCVFQGEDHNGNPVTEASSPFDSVANAAWGLQCPKHHWAVMDRLTSACTKGTVKGKTIIERGYNGDESSFSRDTSADDNRTTIYADGDMEPETRYCTGKTEGTQAEDPPLEGDQIIGTCLSYTVNGKTIGSEQEGWDAHGMASSSFEDNIMGTCEAENLPSGTVLDWSWQVSHWFEDKDGKRYCGPDIDGVPDGESVCE